MSAASSGPLRRHGREVIGASGTCAGAICERQRRRAGTSQRTRGGMGGVGPRSLYHATACGARRRRAAPELRAPGPFRLVSPAPAILLVSPALLLATF